MKKKLIAVETHPIQYKAPLFRLLAREPELDFEVLYAMIPDARQQGAGFGVAFDWDVPLLEGYRHTVLENVARNPAVDRFGGCDTPGIHGLLRQKKPDAVLVNGWVVKTCLQALWACRRLGIPCLVRGEANLLRPRAGWKHVLHRRLLRQYHAYLAMGSANRAFYRHHQCPANRIFHAPYVVDNDWFANAAAAHARNRDALRAAFGIPTDAVAFLFCGKLESKKRPMDVLRALASLSAVQPSRVSAFLLVVGDGACLPACKAFATAHALPVTFAGFLNQSRLPEAYVAADVLVLPSNAGETWGLVVNEAMASGRPALVSRSVGCRQDLVIEGGTGFSFEVGDIATLTALMRGYLSDPGLAQRQGLRAAEHIQRFSLERLVAGVTQAVEQCTRREHTC